MRFVGAPELVAREKYIAEPTAAPSTIIMIMKGNSLFIVALSNGSGQSGRE
jgi:hypothetical protein